MIGNICHLAGYSNPPAVFGNIKQAQKRDIDMLGGQNFGLSMDGNEIFTHALRIKGEEHGRL